MNNRFAWFTRAVTCVALMVGLFAVNALAQTVSGTLRGNVTDANGASIPNATVVARNTETGLERTAVTGGEGNYNMPFLPIGRYVVEVSRSDFNKVIRENVTVNLNDTTVINVRLDAGVSGEVTITDEPPPINSTNAQIAGSLTSQQILERPVANQTNFLTLAETFTGFQENPTSGQNNPTASSGSSVNFNGTGTRGVTFQINGVNNDDSSENQNRQGASLATIKEFQVITNNFTAEFGRGYGAVVLVQTLSGTNNFKGSAYWFHNDQALNAKSYFSHGNKAVFRRNQIGGVLGPNIQEQAVRLYQCRLSERQRRTHLHVIFLCQMNLMRPTVPGVTENDSPSNRVHQIGVRTLSGPDPKRSRKPFAANLCWCDQSCLACP